MMKSQRFDPDDEDSKEMSALWPFSLFILLVTLTLRITLSLALKPAFTLILNHPTTPNLTLTPTLTP